MSLYDCCQHCVEPCPARGHSKPCRECGRTGIGRRPALRVRRYEAWEPRDWSIRGRRSKSA